MFRSKLKVLMAEHNLSNADLANAVGTSMATISNYRNSPKMISLEDDGVWDRLCSYFGCQLGDLIEHMEVSDD